MPPDQAVLLAPKVGEFLSSPYQWRLPFLATDLARELVVAGEVADGLQLLRQVLDSPRVSNDQWLVGRTVEECTKDFFPAAGLEGIKLFCEMLSSVLAERRETAPDSDQDFSYIWRRSLAHDRSRDARDVLITGLREALSAVASADTSSIPALTGELDQRRTAIFSRLALDLVHRYPKGQDDLIAEYLTTERIFRDLHYRREYTNLARDHFTSLSPDQQQLILDWIVHPKDVDQEQRDMFEWQELSRLGRPLPGTWDQRLEELQATFGELQEHDSPGFASFTGPTAPFTKDELRSKTVDELLRFLRDWQPSGEWASPTPEGLAHLLAEVVAANPAPYATAANEFSEVDPTYARALVTGMSNALREGRTFSWAPVLSFARSTISKPRLLEERDENNWDIDPGWKWTRKEVAHLMSAAFKADPPLPLGFSDEVLAILRSLADDPEPHPQDEDDRGNSMDPAMLSLNTVRGATFHALMRYAWWRAKRREAEGLFDDGLQPQVVEILERHLDPTHERARTIRSVYGQWFPYLAVVDEEWTRTHVPAIFSREQAQAELRDVAWESYVTSNRAYKNTFDLLREEYAAEIEALGTGLAKVRPGGRDRDESLADHLLTLYGHGHLELNDVLFERFFSRAPLELRQRAIELVGLGLTNATTVDDEPTARFAELWTSRLSAFKAGESSADELTGFAWSTPQLNLGSSRERETRSGRFSPPHSTTARGLGRRHARSSTGSRQIVTPSSLTSCSRPPTKVSDRPLDDPLSVADAELAGDQLRQERVA